MYQDQTDYPDPRVNPARLAVQENEEAQENQAQRESKDLRVCQAFKVHRVQGDPPGLLVKMVPREKLDFRDQLG